MKNENAKTGNDLAYPSLEQAIADSLSRENLFGPYKTVDEAMAAMLEDDDV